MLHLPGFKYFAFRFSLFAFYFLFLQPSAHAQNSAYDIQVGSYIRTYSAIAVDEMNRFRGQEAGVDHAEAFIRHNQSGKGLL